jgi:hypothetical protein
MKDGSNSLVIHGTKIKELILDFRMLGLLSQCSLIFNCRDETTKTQSKQGEADSLSGKLFFEMLFILCKLV